MSNTFRTFNYTGRSRIKKDSIEIKLKKEKNDLISGIEIKLDTEKVESDQKKAKAILEGHYLTEYERFELGKIKDLKAFYEFELDEPIYAESLIFRLMVVGPKGRILAQADQIRPTKEESEDILNVDLLDLGKKSIWEVQYRGRRGAPVLVLNNNIPGIRNALEKDSDFRLAVLPSAFRNILFRIAFIEDIEDPENVSVEWHNNWLKFSSEVLDIETPDSLKFDGSSSKKEDLERWIDRNVESLGENLSEEWSKSKKGWGT